MNGNKDIAFQHDMIQTRGVMFWYRFSPLGQGDLMHYESVHNEIFPSLPAPSSLETCFLQANESSLSLSELSSSLIPPVLTGLRNRTLSTVSLWYRSVRVGERSVQVNRRMLNKQNAR